MIFLKSRFIIALQFLQILANSVNRLLYSVNSNSLIGLEGILVVRIMSAFNLDIVLVKHLYGFLLLNSGLCLMVHIPALLPFGLL